MGISLEETVGTMAELASNGVLADKAGTGLRGVLGALTSPSAKAADTTATSTATELATPRLER